MSHTDLPAFVYPVLIDHNDIRVVELLPATDTVDPIRCRLKHVSLNDSSPVRYIALSYTWGDTTSRASIIVSHREHDERTLSVTTNLQAALRRMRGTDGESVWMWIDFICINQSDLIERSLQAGKMKDVYQKAAEVYVWLGEHDVTSLEAWELVKDIVLGPKSRILRARRKQFLALYGFFRRPYWTRIWVIQEVNNGGNAVTVFCGQDTIPWLELEGVCDKLREVKEHIATKVFPNDASMSNVLLNGGPKNLELSRFSSDKAFSSLFELLLTHTGKASTDPKDKVYALVGLSTSASTFGILDYTSSERDAFIHTAKHIITVTNKLNTICLRQNEDNKYNLPSWVTDWERRVKAPNHRIMGLHIRQPQFTASNGSLPHFDFLPADVLKFRGHLVDEIGDIMGLPFHMKGYQQSEAKIRHTLMIFDDWWRVYATTRGSRKDTEEFISTMYGGKWSALAEPLPYTRRYEALDNLLKVIVFPGNETNWPPGAAQESYSYREAYRARGQEYRAMVSHASLRIHGKRFAMTSKQDLSCLVPMDTVSGDLICIIYGCDFPVVLRRSGDKYSLVGEAYVHGIMQGETMTSKYEVEDFLLV